MSNAELVTPESVSSNKSKCVQKIEEGQKVECTHEQRVRKVSNAEIVSSNRSKCVTKKN